MKGCDFAGCKEDPIVKVRTGSDRMPAQTVALCDRHRDEHWQEVRGPVAAGVMHYTIMPITSSEI